MMVARFSSLLALLALTVTVDAVVAVAAPHALRGDKAERELLVSLDRQKYIRAREQAEKILRKNADSIIARYGLASVFHLEETNLPRALYHSRLAEKKLLARYNNPPRDTLVKQWHRKLLVQQERLLGEMDRNKKQLAVLARHDKLYRPKRESRRVWPLMKLHRFAEAKKIAEKYARSSDLYERISGFNGLLSIEFERERPLACYTAAMRAVRATAERSCVLDLNTSEAAMAVYKFAEAERLALKSIQAPIKDCPSPAHQHLVNIYLARGDFRRAISALKDFRKHGVERRYRQQFETTITAWLARLYFALGQLKKSYDLTERSIVRPDRVGMVSFSPESMQAIWSIDHYASLKARGEQLREQISGRSGWEKVKLWGKRQEIFAKRWVLRRKISRLLAGKRLLASLSRPYVKPFPSWRMPLLVEVAGAGVVEQAVQKKRVGEKLLPQSEAYWAAMFGEHAFRSGNYSKAKKLASRALSKLPKAEVLLRARVEAWSAQIALSEKNTTRAAKLFHRVMHRWPAGLRILSLALPVRVQASTDPLALKVARYLRKSPRLRVTGSDLGFAVRITINRGHLQSCVTGTRGRRYACSLTDLSKLEGKAEDEKIAAAVDQFHRDIFAPMIDLTQEDINTLDGRAVRGRADEVLKEVFGK
jgi:tetratricopeptide (TPR) repeat protein